jgi:hypothetical protein
MLLLGWSSSYNFSDTSGMGCSSDASPLRSQLHFPSMVPPSALRRDDTHVIAGEHSLDVIPISHLGFSLVRVPGPEVLPLFSTPLPSTSHHIRAFE